MGLYVVKKCDHCMEQVVSALGKDRSRLKGAMQVELFINRGIRPICWVALDD